MIRLHGTCVARILVGVAPGHASVVHASDAGSDSGGSGSAVRAPTVSKLTGEAPERNKDSISEMTLTNDIVNAVSPKYIGYNIHKCT